MNTRTDSSTADLATAPPVQRSPMRTKPWFGLMRGVLFALWPGVRFAPPHTDTPLWLRAAINRRRTLLVLVAALAATAAVLQAASAPDQPGVLWWLQAGLGTLLFAWVGAGFVTALMGARVLRRGDRHALALHAPQRPIDAAARTAMIMPICNEDVATVFAGLRTTCASLAATGALKLFDIYVLSDSSDPALRAAELREWQALRDDLGDAPVRDGGRIFYRWRRRRTRRKAGNVADFCRRWGRNYRYMVVLDADSVMQGDTLVSLVRLMEQQPRAGIVQTLPQGLNPRTLHARLQHFGNRVTGRLFALGMAYWQLGESHYWGHNAILRVAPFMQHCALAPIAGRGGLAGDILSHDFVEAALMRRAGYEVWLAPQLQGSWEQHPSNLLEELQRDRRWCQGNLQNAQLVAEPGLRPVHRAMLTVGALSYLMAPLWLAFVAIGLGAGIGFGSGVALWMLTLLLLVLPRLLGAWAVLWRGEQARFGGRARLWGSAALELLLSTLQAPPRMLAHSVFVLGALTGLRLDWKSPARAAAAVGWREAMSRIGVLTLPALVLVAAAVHGHGLGAPHLAPLLLPLLLAVPFAVWTGSPGAGRGLGWASLLLAPGDRNATPPTAQRTELLGASQSVQRTGASPRAAQRAPLRSMGFAVSAGLALSLMVFLPRLADSPELTSEMHSAQQWLAFDQLRAQERSIDAVDTAAPAATAKPRRVISYPPARMIDDEVRRRAYEAVARTPGLGVG